MKFIYCSIRGIHLTGIHWIFRRKWWSLVVVEFTLYNMLFRIDDKSKMLVVCKSLMLLDNGHFSPWEIIWKCKSLILRSFRTLDH